MKLPLEIRFMIYKYLFGCQTFHLYPTRADKQGSGKFRHHVCGLTPPLTASNPGDALRSCMPRGELDFGSFFWPYPGVDMCTFSHPEWASRADIGILKTCRQACFEGSHQLYRLNTFDFANPIAFSWFASTVGQENLASISKLQIRLDLDWRVTDESWMAMWADISEKMTGLTEISILIQYTFKSELSKNANKTESLRIKDLTEKHMSEEISKICKIRYPFDEETTVDEILDEHQNLEDPDIDETLIPP
jgi:hypothetical protein